MVRKVATEMPTVGLGNMSLISPNGERAAAGSAVKGFADLGVSEKLVTLLQEARITKPTAIQALLLPAIARYRPPPLPAPCVTRCQPSYCF